MGRSRSPARRAASSTSLHSVGTRSRRARGRGLAMRRRKKYIGQFKESREIGLRIRVMAECLLGKRASRCDRPVMARDEGWMASTC